MNRQEKKDEVEKLREGFQGVDSAILVGFLGLGVVETTELRRKIRAAAGNYRVVKNRLALRAIGKTGLKGLSDILKGPTAVVSGGDDPLALSRVLRDFSKDHPALVLKGGLVEGRKVSAEGIARLASLPGRTELIGHFLGVLGAPVSRFCLVLQAPLRGFVTVLREIVRKRS